MNAQSVKHTDTATLNGYDADKKILGIKRHIAVDTQGVSDAVAVTTAELTGRKGALAARERCKRGVSRVQSLLCESGYTGQPFVQGVQEILGGHTTVQIAKSSELHTSRSCPSVGWPCAALLGRTRTGGCGKTSSGS